MANASGLTSGLEDGAASLASTRGAAFAAARRHSRRVSYLKFLFVGACLAAVASLVGIGVYDPLGHLPKGVSVASTTLSGTKITMEHPKLSGFRRDGRPYQLLASSGVQDIKNPNIVELNDIDAMLTMADRTVLKLSSPHGFYDTSANRMQVVKDVRVTDSSLYDAHLESADLDFKAGSILSNDPVTVVTASATIAADKMAITDNGDDVVFDGNVRSTIASPGPVGESKP